MKQRTFRRCTNESAETAVDVAVAATGHHCPDTTCQASWARGCTLRSKQSAAASRRRFNMPCTSFPTGPMVPTRSSRDESQNMGLTGDQASQRRHAVCVRFSSQQNRRLRQPDPLASANGGPIWDERPLLLERSDGTYELMGLSSNLEGLVRWVLSFAGDAEVESPVALRRRVRRAACRIVALNSVVHPDL